MIIAGPEEAAHAVHSFLPEALQASVVGILALHSHSSAADARAAALPMLVAFELGRKSRLLAELRNRAEARTSGVLGLDATLEALSRGEVMTLVGSRDLDASAWECPACSLVAVRPGACAACGGTVSPTSLRQILPVLARRHGARLEVVGPAAQPPPPEGLGALLRYVLSRGPARAPARDQNARGHQHSIGRKPERESSARPMVPPALGPYRGGRMVGMATDLVPGSALLRPPKLAAERVRRNSLARSQRIAR